MRLMQYPTMLDVAMEILSEKPIDGGLSLSVCWWSIHGNKHFGTKPFAIEFETLEMSTELYNALVPCVVRPWYPRLYKNQQETKEDE